MSVEHLTAGRPSAVTAGRRLRAGAAVRAIPRPLAALLIAATLLQVAWALFTPALQGPDETGHAAYVQRLAETGDGPDAATTQGGLRSAELEAFIRWHNVASVVGMAAGRPGWSEAERAAWERVERDARRDDGAGPNPLAQNPPLYYAYDAVAYRVASGFSLPTRLLAMRLANLPLLWLVIGCAWLAMAELFRRTFARTVGTGAVALLPMVTFLSGVVNPEIALAAAATAAIALSLAALRLGPRAGVLLGLGAIGAAGVLIHGRGLALVPAIVFVLALVLWRGRGGPVPRSHRALAAAGALALIGVGALAAIVYSNAHAGASSLSGELTGSSSSGLENASGLFDYVWQFYFSPLTDMPPPPGEGLFGYRQMYVEQFLGGAFGSLEVRFPSDVYRALQIVQGIGLPVLVGAVARRWELVRAHAAQALVLLAFAVSTLALLHVAAWQDLNTDAPADLLTGRYLLPLVAVFGAAVAFVVEVMPPRVRAGLGAAVLATGASLCVGGIALTLVRFHA